MKETRINIRFDFNIREMLKKIAYGGFGHHWNISYGNHIEELIELLQDVKNQLCSYAINPILTGITIILLDQMPHPRIRYNIFPSG